MNKKSSTRKPTPFLAAVNRYKFFYIMLIPILLYFLVFSYYPLVLGIIKSFQDVKLLGDAEFIGMNNYTTTATHPYYREAFVNTIVVNFGTFILQFIWGLIIALLLNEIKNKIFKSAIQSVTYIPNLLSWSVVGGIWMGILSPTGMINGILKIFMGTNFKPITFMAESSMARSIFIFTGAWKGAGYTAVLLLAAIVAIDPSIYEAASIDGATRLQQLTKITIPNLIPTMKTIVVLASMGILRNFDQVFVMRRPNIDEKIRNLLYLIFEQGISKSKVGPACAAATILLIATFIISSGIRKLIHYDETYN